MIISWLMMSVSTVGALYFAHRLGSNWFCLTGCLTGLIIWSVNLTIDYIKAERK